MTRKNKAAGGSNLTPEHCNELSKFADDIATPDPANRPARNIKFVGRPIFAPGKRKILSDPQPLESVSFLGRPEKLPPADFQKRVRLFYHESAAEIAAAFPHLYKQIIPKGK